MSRKKITCRFCGESCRRLHAHYRQAWGESYPDYRVVYRCRACGKRMALITMEEESYERRRNEIYARVRQLEEALRRQNQLVRQLRDAARVSLLLRDVDQAINELNRLKTTINKGFY